MGKFLENDGLIIWKFHKILQFIIYCNIPLVLCSCREVNVKIAKVLEANIIFSCIVLHIYGIRIV